MWAPICPTRKEIVLSLLFHVSGAIQVTNRRPKPCRAVIDRRRTDNACAIGHVTTSNRVNTRILTHTHTHSSFMGDDMIMTHVRTVQLDVITARSSCAGRIAGMSTPPYLRTAVDGLSVFFFIFCSSIMHVIMSIIGKLSIRLSRVVSVGTLCTFYRY